MAAAREQALRLQHEVIGPEHMLLAIAHDLDRTGDWQAVLALPLVVPLVVRSAAGDCLTVNFTNLLAPVANPNNAQQDQLINNDQVAGRCAGFHASGTELRTSMADDGSMVGANGIDDGGANIGDSTQGAAVCGEGMVEPDANGRIQLPLTLRQVAGLEKKVVLLGMGSRFEVWNENVLNQKRLDEERSLEEAASEEMTRLVL